MKGARPWMLADENYFDRWTASSRQSSATHWHSGKMIYLNNRIANYSLEEVTKILERKNMPTFQSEIGEEDQPVIVEFEISPVVKGRDWLPNGDPGCPDEGGELESLIVMDMDGNDITSTMGEQDFTRLKEKAYEVDRDWIKDNWNPPD